MMKVQLHRKKTKNNERNIISNGLKTQANLFRLQYLPLETLEKNYNRVTKYIMRDLLETVQKKDKQNLHF